LVTPATLPRFRAAHLFPEVSVDVDERSDGTLLLRTVAADAGIPRSIAAALVERAERLGERTFLAQRGADDEWRRISYGDARLIAARVAGWFASREPARAERVLIVTGNSLAHAMLTYGAAFAGVPVCPVSVQYAASPSGRYDRLRHVVGLVRPTVVFAEAVGPVADALTVVLPDDVTVICTDPENWAGAVDWDDVAGHAPVADPDAAVAAIDPDTPLRYMLTSGSTGLPKVVIQTNRMWCTLFAGANSVLAEASGWGVRTLDWMPWSHVAGVSVLTGSLINGGTFYIDDGRPTPELFGTTLRNLAEIQPLFFANVPYAFAMLCDALEADAELRGRFFEHLQLCLYGGAGLPQPVYDRFQVMAEETIGERVMFTTGYGCTETTAGVMSVSWPTTKVGVGLPLPGIEVKLVPLDDERYEARFRAECVMPGYLDNPQASATAFDDEGFYRSGDALAFIDASDPTQGLVFAGRLAEEFKLSTGTFVPGGRLHAEMLARTSPVVSEMLICGEGHDEVGLLLWLNPVGCAATLGIEAPIDQLAQDPGVLDWISARIAGAAADGGSSTSVARFAVLTHAPDSDAGEVSDKGSINQSIALKRRAGDVDRLYAGGPGVRVLT
jgi:feruloyl-CoA synthase